MSQSQDIHKVWLEARQVDIEWAAYREKQLWQDNSLEVGLDQIPEVGMNAQFH